MSTPEEKKDPNITPVTDDDGSRPWVDQYVNKPSFYIGDQVYLLNSNGTREGPYVIASLPSHTKCTLSWENGAPVRNGLEISTDLVEAL